MQNHGLKPHSLFSCHFIFLSARICLFQLLSAPFQAGLLYLPAPWCLISHMFGCLIGEAWIGVCVAVLLENVPVDLTASATGLYFFVLQMTGGATMPLLVTPLSRPPLDLRAALMICFPGFYVLSAVLFGVTLVLARRAEQAKKKQKGEGSVVVQEVGAGDYDGKEMEVEKQEQLLQNKA